MGVRSQKRGETRGHNEKQGSQGTDSMECAHYKWFVVLKHKDEDYQGQEICSLLHKRIHIFWPEPLYESLITFTLNYLYLVSFQNG